MPGLSKCVLFINAEFGSATFVHCVHFFRGSSSFFGVLSCFLSLSLPLTLTLTLTLFLLFKLEFYGSPSHCSAWRWCSASSRNQHAR